MRLASTLRIAFSLPFSTRLYQSSRYFCTSLFSSSDMSSYLPKPPSNPLSDFGVALQTTLNTHMQGIDAELSNEDDSKDDFFKNVRKFHIINDDLSQAVKSGMLDSVSPLIDSSEAMINQLIASIGNDPCARESKLFSVMEKSRSVLLLHRFFTEGRLASQASLQPCNDSEYIAAVLTFAQLLNQYVLGRACEGDVASINLCLGVVTELNMKMLEFDFRNGPLRRKYDGLKYAVRNIEDILFELSLQSPETSSTRAGVSTTEEEVASPTKRMRLEESNQNQESEAVGGANAATESISGPIFRFLDDSEIDAIRSRMDHYDQLRELVIKDSRDIQKLSKQAVYGVIRGQLQDTRRKLDLAAKNAEKIMETIKDFPTLRQGGFSNSLEEWAEGAITLEWVQNKRIPSPQELGLVNSAEYIGALSDFTGEIGRLAVMHAGKRDFAAVKEIYQADLVVSAAITRLSGNRFGKKLDMVNQNLKKVGDVIYELSMLQRSGRATRTKPVDLAAPSSNSEAPVQEQD
mmetsp:Transcript_120330/g.236483  ORF Transcript_120330/g.236483 Transcript_120330/m.236483 type:complete len:519 (+) Transcript_120330:8-1564(+)